MVPVAGVNTEPAGSPWSVTVNTSPGSISVPVKFALNGTFAGMILLTGLSLVHVGGLPSTISIMKSRATLAQTGRTAAAVL